MSGCEKCWGRAFTRAYCNGTSQSEEYQKLLKENEGKCSPEEQAGEWWDEEKQIDKRYATPTTQTRRRTHGK